MNKIIYLFQKIKLPYEKVIFTLILLIFISSSLSNLSTWKDFSNNNSLKEYIISNRKGTTYLFSFLTREHLDKLKIEQANILFFRDKNMSNQPHFIKIFSDGVAEITLYPFKLNQKVNFRYILTDEEFNNFIKNDWIEKKAKGINFFFPKMKSCNNYKIMIYKDSNVFLFPFCSNNNLI